MASKKKAPKKLGAKKDEKTELQLLIQSTLNSAYSLFIPCQDGNYVYVKNPVEGTTRHFQTNKAEFIDYIKLLAKIGFTEKIKKDIEELVKKNPKDWTKVYEFLKKEKTFDLLNQEESK